MVSQASSLLGIPTRTKVSEKNRLDTFSQLVSQWGQRTALNEEQLSECLRGQSSRGTGFVLLLTWPPCGASEDFHCHSLPADRIPTQTHVNRSATAAHKHAEELNQQQDQSLKCELKQTQAPKPTSLKAPSGLSASIPAEETVLAVED